MYLSVAGNRSFVSTGGRDFDPSKTVLLFLHGSGQSHLSFQLQGRFFANRGYQLLVPDLPAHGHSDGTALTSIEDQADWCAALLDAAGVLQAHIIGHSQGGLIGLEFAHRHAQYVRSLSMVASALSIGVNQALLDMAQNNEHAAIEAMIDWGHGRDGHSHDHTVPGNSHMNYGTQLMAFNQPGTLFADLTACSNYKNGAQAATSLNIPTRAILASRDRMTPLKSGRAMAQAIGDADPAIIKGAGHMLPSEQPFAINKAMRPIFGEPKL